VDPSGGGVDLCGVISRPGWGGPESWFSGGDDSGGVIVLSPGIFEIIGTQRFASQMSSPPQSMSRTQCGAFDSGGFTHAPIAQMRGDLHSSFERHAEAGRAPRSVTANAANVSSEGRGRAVRR
jgi:hypothetical protein